MLSIAFVKNSASAGNYYSETDNYYTQDSSPSQWSGKGAQLCGLSGPVAALAFKHLLEGQVLDGSTIHNAADGRRAGIDLTFSAPKSVSMQTLIGGDERLIDAHEKAVMRALDFAEGLAAYRVTENRITRLEASDNLIVASFRHDLSRAADPNLHTHAVVINATQRSDAQWRALEAGEILRQKMLLGALYRSELALEVQNLGYEIRQTHVDGRFELAHIDDKQIEAFSSRSQSIESALAIHGKDRDSATARQKEVVALTTREAKGEVDRGLLREIWREKSQSLGIDYSPSLLDRVQANDFRLEAAQAAVEFAIAHTTERQAVVAEAELVRFALEHGTGGTDLDAIRTELARQSKLGKLIQEGNRYTTQAAQQREREILALEKRGRGAVAPILREQQASQSLSRTSLNAGQMAAASLVVTTDSRIAAIQGAAGTGKTTMLREANKMLDANGYQTIGLAPSAAAARELGKAGIESQTIASFNQREYAGLNAKSILIVDEAGMVPAKEMREILTKAEAAHARVVLVGDVQQLKAIEAGKPFAQLQEAGIARVKMGEIQRQHNTELRQSVELAARGDVAGSLNLLEKQIVEIEDHQTRHQTVAKAFAALPDEARDNTLILAGTHMARTAINENVRADLGLAGKGVDVSILSRKDLTSVQARSSLSYQVGDIIQAQKSYPSLSMARGDFARVAEIADGRVTLEHDDGKRFQWQPALQTNLTAYREEMRELSVGDVVRLTANQHALGIINGERATVTALSPENQTVTLLKADGNKITLDTDKPLHLDHGYCSTVHSAQGQTCDHVLIDADTRSATANESSYYVAISRARESATIYTDNRLMLPDAMARLDEKSAALDIAPEHSPQEPEMAL